MNETPESLLELLIALETYTVHKQTCAANEWKGNRTPCNCGLDALLARLPK